MNSIFNLHVLLSRKNIKTLTINFDELFTFNNSDACNKKNIKFDTKPMSVFFLKSESNIKKMKDLEKYHLSNLVNLILFIKSEETHSLEFCSSPIGNPFPFRKESKFLVNCYGNSSIQEWQPINTTQMSVYEWATWKPNSGLIIKKSNLMFKKKNQLNRQVLLVTTVKVTHKTSTSLQHDYFRL